MENLVAIILAAGVGKRMKSKTSKVLHEICGKPMISYVVDVLKANAVEDIVVVVGRNAEEVQDYLRKYDVKTVVQKKLLGTADALTYVKPHLSSLEGNCLVLCADIPLIKETTIKRLLEAHDKSKASCTFLTATFKNPSGYGRVLRNEGSKILKIVEEKDASVFEKAIEEINVGAYCFKSADLFSAIEKVKPSDKTGEYYLTEVISVFSKTGKRIESVEIDDLNEASGINSRKQLANANCVINERILDSLMESGVTIIDPKNTYIEGDVQIGQDTIIYPFTIIHSDVKIGSSCSIGPFARIRSGSVIEDESVVGNFVEINRSRIGAKSRVKHHTYLGDTQVGKDVNIGAGTIVANYNGKEKNITQIGDSAFIGSGTILIAPVNIGKQAITGAGSVVCKKTVIPARAVVVGVPAKILKRTTKRK